MNRYYSVRIIFHNTILGLPRYARGKEVRRRGYARYRFLKGFKVSLRGSVRAGVGHGELTRAVQGRG
ncbi:hypothetical protein MetMK1DRAFT_00008950 [Metallosphaera yellowstonensis MK1]|uniref:Uncharacterized protein n=1 Tax=Metallosphaera yellowstonensis MK1 TaxID=671065 RepID=H2C2C2_9CREN|nr:hypothetical protein MetMK1DRAFT_00008950 [Metallosphaera yellowstonensis MK1]